MGVEIKLTDKEFPVSPVFIDFLHRHIEEKEFDTTWFNQLSESLVPTKAAEKRESAVALAPQILQHPTGQQAIYRCYELFTALLTGVPEKLRILQERYKFICVVGCPRHGGSYLTKQLFLALGMDAEKVPNVIAHDGFPESAPFEFKESHNSATVMTQSMAEYLAMVELYFASSRMVNNRIVVPKKATKAAYNGAFFNTVFGPQTEYIITLRHPIAACISTYEKSTGYPVDGKFKARGNIEEWMRRDNIFNGEDVNTLNEKDYFDTYLRYWEQYHYALALTGLPQSKSWTIVSYGGERMQTLAKSFFTRFKSKGTPDEFKIFDKRDRHQEWRKKAESAVNRVTDVSHTVGLTFPRDEIMECW